MGSSIMEMQRSWTRDNLELKVDVHTDSVVLKVKDQIIVMTPEDVDQLVEQLAISAADARQRWVEDVG